MRRKIIKQGAATLTLSLPAKWTKKFNIKAGGEVEVEEKDAALLVYPGKQAYRKREITIEINEENKKDLRTILTHLYRQAFDTIKFTNINSEILKNISKVTNDFLLGFEVTERGKNHCKVTNISEPTEQKYEVLLRRCFLIIKETQHLIKEDFAANKFNRIPDMEELRNQQDKFVLFCRRILIKQNERNAILAWELLTYLLHINHAYYYMYTYAAENKISKSQKIVDFLSKLDDYFALFYDAFYKKDINCVHKVNDLKGRYQFGDCYKQIEKSKGSEAVILSHIRELFRLMQLGTSPIVSQLFYETL